MSSTNQPPTSGASDPPDPLRRRTDCPSPELLAAYAEGRRLWGQRRRLEAHFAECDRCIALLVEVATFRAEHPEAGESARESAAADAEGGIVGLLRRPPRLLWAASGSLALAAAIIVAVLVREPAGPDLDALIAAVGDQRVTDARLVGFHHGRRPDVLRSADPAAALPPLSLDAQAVVAEVQERAVAASTANAMHTLGISRLIAGDLDAAIQTLERASNVDPPNARFLSDLSAAYLTRGIRQNNRQDVQHALAVANQAVDLDRMLLDAHFNRALALDKLDQPVRARAAWQDYLKLDSTSPWADEARERLAATQPPKP